MADEQLAAQMDSTQPTEQVTTAVMQTKPAKTPKRVAVGKAIAEKDTTGSRSTEKSGGRGCCHNRR